MATVQAPEITELDLQTAEEKRTHPYQTSVSTEDFLNQQETLSNTQFDQIDRLAAIFDQILVLSSTSQSDIRQYLINLYRDIQRNGLSSVDQLEAKIDNHLYLTKERSLDDKDALRQLVKNDIHLLAFLYGQFTGDYSYLFSATVSHRKEYADGEWLWNIFKDSSPILDRENGVVVVAFRPISLFGFGVMKVFFDQAGFNDIDRIQIHIPLTLEEQISLSENQNDDSLRRFVANILESQSYEGALTFIRDSRQNKSINTWSQELQTAVSQVSNLVDQTGEEGYRIIGITPVLNRDAMVGAEDIAAITSAALIGNMPHAIVGFAYNADGRPTTGDQAAVNISRVFSEHNQLGVIVMAQSFEHSTANTPAGTTTYTLDSDDPSVWGQSLRQSARIQLQVTNETNYSQITEPQALGAGLIPGLPQLFQKLASLWSWFKSDHRVAIFFRSIIKNTLVLSSFIFLSSNNIAGTQDIIDLFRLVDPLNALEKLYLYTALNYLSTNPSALLLILVPPLVADFVYAFVNPILYKIWPNANFDQAVQNIKPIVSVSEWIKGVINRIVSILKKAMALGSDKKITTQDTIRKRAIHNSKTLIKTLQIPKSDQETIRKFNSLMQRAKNANAHIYVVETPNGNVIVISKDGSIPTTALAYINDIVIFHEQFNPCRIGSSCGVVSDYLVISGNADQTFEGVSNTDEPANSFFVEYNEYHAVAQKNFPEKFSIQVDITSTNIFKTYIKALFVIDDLDSQKIINQIYGKNFQQAEIEDPEYVRSVIQHRLNTPIQEEDQTNDQSIIRKIKEYLNPPILSPLPDAHISHSLL
jgi:hypothetical protein